MARRKTREEFIDDARKVHGVQYSYELVDYVNARTKVKIIHLQCGRVFEQTPDSHLGGSRCTFCFGPHNRTLEDFIFKARKKHGDKYDYSQGCYIDSRTKIKITHIECGRIFEQSPSAHVKGQGCPFCFGKPKKTTEEFILEASILHGDSYDYAGVQYDGDGIKVEIKHKECGRKFRQSPSNHLRGRGCPFCFGTPKRTLEDFTLEAGKVHGSIYDYSEVALVDGETKVKIKHIECGKSFYQTPHYHLAGGGCVFCYGRESLKKTKEAFILEAKALHGNAYDYRLVESSGWRSSVQIIHIECGQVFEQEVRVHLAGHGCPSCAARGFKSDKPGVLYYVRFDLLDGGALYKIGITNLSVQERFNQEPTPYTVISETPYLFGWLARESEQKILSKYARFRYKGPDVLRNGNTELFTKDVLMLDKRAA